MNSKFKIAGIGELLWDVLPGGKELGGAPGRFCIHTAGSHSSTTKKANQSDRK